MKYFKLIAGGASCAFILAACSTSQKQVGGVNTGLLTESPQSVPAALEAAKIVLQDYGKGLKSSDRTRRMFNVLGVVAGAYTAIGAGIETAPDNLVFSTSLSAALPLLEPSFQGHGSPEVIGEAIVKTSCIIRQAGAATTSDVLTSVEALRLINEPATNTIVGSYDNLANRIVDGYMAVYYNYAVSKVPPALSSEKIKQSFSIKPAAQEEAENTAAAALSPAGRDEKSFFEGSMKVAPGVGLTTAQKQKLAGIVTQATKTAEKQISDCITTVITSGPAG